MQRISRKNGEEGDSKSPLFIPYIMDQELVKRLVDEAIQENESLFLIDLKFLPNNKIQVVVDGDHGVNLNECVRVSRHVEHNLDREKEDFALEVTSPDITQPLSVECQYQKNINRILSIKTEEENFEGTLVSVNHEGVVLQWKAREPKPIGKGKRTVEKRAEIAYRNIKEAKVKITF